MMYENWRILLSFYFYYRDLMFEWKLLFVLPTIYSGWKFEYFQKGGIHYDLLNNPLHEGEVLKRLLLTSPSCVITTNSKIDNNAYDYNLSVLSMIWS